jgi:hypothetical protein
MMAERRGKRRAKERRPQPETGSKSDPVTPTLAELGIGKRAKFGPDSFPWRVGELIVGIPRRRADGEAGSA